MPSFKVRLEPNRIAIAEIPEERFKELGIQKFPEERIQNHHGQYLNAAAEGRKERI